MNIIKRVSASVLAASIATSLIPQQATANPAALAVPAICAGTAGVGCVLIGAGIVGTTVVYYIYRQNNGSKIKVTPSGRVFKSEYLEDPEELEEVGTWEDPLDTPSYQKAKQICESQAKRLGATLVEIKRHPVTKKLSCVFQGGHSR